MGFALKGFFVELANFKVFLFDVIILFVEDIVEVGTFECLFLVLCGSLVSGFVVDRC